MPICIGHAKSAATKEFIYKMRPANESGEWFTPTLRIVSGGNCPLPVPQHAKVLDVLLALFSNNFNEEGEVWFTYKDIAMLLGISTTNNTVIKEAIRRYLHMNLFFEKCWATQPGRFTSEVFHTVKKTDLFEEEKDHNPRNSRKKEHLHYVKFDQKIVDSVQAKQIRLFPRDAFKELDAWSYILYKIFYAPTDKEPVRRTINFIESFLGWSSGAPRLRSWIVKNLEHLKKKKFILWWQVQDNCYEVQANPAKYRKDDEFLSKQNPLVSEKNYAHRIISSKKLSKFSETKAKEQTFEALKNVTAKPEKKKNVVKEIAKTSAATQIFSQLASMSESQRNMVFSFLNSVPESERDELFMQKLLNILPKKAG
jgi:alkylated DNA nucleotide flippase Atl1